MALADFIPTIWAALYTTKLRESLVWGMRCNRSYEGEIRMAGDTVKIPTGTSNVAIGDYTENTDIAQATFANGTTTDLNVDKQKYFHFYVDDIHRTQTRPDIMAEIMRESAFQMAKQTDEDARTEFNTAYDASRSVRVTDDLTATDVTQKIFRAFVKTKNEMNKIFLPQEMRWAVVHPDLISILDDFFVVKGNSNIWFPVSSESTLRNGFAGRLLGFDLYVTTLVPELTVSSKDYWRYFCGQGMEAVTMAEQIVEIESYRPQRRFGDAVKGLNVYGHKAVLPTRLFTIEMQKGIITA